MLGLSVPRLALFRRWTALNAAAIHALSTARSDSAAEKAKAEERTLSIFRSCVACRIRYKRSSNSRHSLLGVSGGAPSSRLESTLGDITFLCVNHIGSH